MTDAPFIFWGIILAALVIVALVTWHGYFMSACLADGHAHSWCTVQFWSWL